MKRSTCCTVCVIVIIQMILSSCTITPKTTNETNHNKIADNNSMQSIPNRALREQIKRLPIPKSYSYRANQFSNTFTVFQDTLFFLCPLKESEQGLVAFDTKQNRFLWTYSWENAIPMMEKMAISEKMVFLGSDIHDKEIGQEKNFLVAVDSLTGKESWRFYIQDNLPEPLKDSKDKIESAYWIGGFIFWKHQVFGLIEVTFLNQDQPLLYFASIDEITGHLIGYYMAPEDYIFSDITLYQLIGSDLYLSGTKQNESNQHLLCKFDLISHQFSKLFPLSAQQLLPIQNQAVFLGTDQDPYALGSFDLKQQTVIWKVNQQDLPSQKKLHLSDVFFWQDHVVTYDDYSVFTYHLKQNKFLPSIQLDNSQPYAFHAGVQYEGILYLAMGPQDWNQGESYILAFHIDTQRFLWKWKLPSSSFALYVCHGLFVNRNNLYFHCNNGALFCIPLTKNLK